jgi:hypothetical protein
MGAWITLRIVLAIIALIVVVSRRGRRRANLQQRFGPPEYER